MLYKIYKFFEFPETVWYSFFVFMWLGFSTVIISFFLFREKKMYTITEIVDKFCNEDIMNTPVSIREEYKHLLRMACKKGKIKSIKIKGKWYIYKKSEAIKYLMKYYLRGET